MKKREIRESIFFSTRVEKLITLTYHGKSRPRVDVVLWNRWLSRHLIRPAHINIMFKYDKRCHSWKILQKKCHFLLKEPHSMQGTRAFR